MAVLAADVNAHAEGASTILPGLNNVADIFYRGSIVFCDTAGGVQVLPAAGDRVVGISPKKQTLAAGDQAEFVAVGAIWMPLGTNISAADEGELLVLDISAAQSDNPADMVAAADITLGANDAAVGAIIRVTATEMLILFGGFTGRIYDATAAAWV